MVQKIPCSFLLPLHLYSANILFSFLFVPRQNNSKLYARVCTLFCTYIAASPYETTSALYPVRLRELSSRVYQRVFSHKRHSQLVKWLRQPASRYSWGGKSASSSSRSCRALEITGISARVGINIEIFLWATNRHSSWEKLSFFQRYPPVCFPFIFLALARFI